MPPLDTRALQARILAAGHDCGAVDGRHGTKTATALTAAGGIPGLGIHPSGLHSIVLHWTAGAYGFIELELAHYHLVIGVDGRAVAGHLKPEANADISDGRYAAHTRAANSGRIGVAVDAMAGAVERPFDAGSAPITSAQFAGLCEAVADLCETYSIPVSRWTLLTHAEVERTLGIPQRAKWDITWLPGMDAPGDPVAVGNRIRGEITTILRKRGAAARPGTVPPVRPDVEPAFRRSPSALEAAPPLPKTPFGGGLRLSDLFPCLRSRK